MNKSNKDRLLIFKRKSRRNLGAVKENGVWRTEYNFELQQKFKETNIVKGIKDSNLRCLGYIYRYGNENSVEKITF